MQDHEINGRYLGSLISLLVAVSSIEAESIGHAMQKATSYLELLRPIYEVYLNEHELQCVVACRWDSDFDVAAYWGNPPEPWILDKSRDHTFQTSFLKLSHAVHSCIEELVASEGSDTLEATKEGMQLK
eukprot:404712-Amphidinium_carterae.1